ncbi:MAG: hypothetical protein CVU54_00115 [Deltaproteobacteria bacterium HGW-Deltaproteobacteria-12]|nr:MAG: hypothetical protein CVU54_00115 [Deltaproteobacteria bacterium HGW-Deltaproteobacteria-12]
MFTLYFFCANMAFANPYGAQVVNGSVSINTQGNTLTVTNSPNSIINWQGFSIASNEAVRFIQQSSQSAVLNRIIGQNPSAILGALQSNGRVFLINPNGILFGQGAQINVNGLVASTLNLSNQDFLAGRYNFTAGTVAGAIQNQGTITTPTGGKVYLIAPNIENSGIINTPKGDIILAAGHSVQLVDSLDPDIAVVVSAPENKALNLGSIMANSGKIGIYGGLIAQKGIVSADSAVVGENGKIFFKATKDITLDAGSSTSAQGGGTIKILGGMDEGVVTVNGALDASAPNGGDGGFIETSAAKVIIGDTAAITTLAPYGKTGTWLIDPTNYAIAAGGNITGAALSAQLNSSNVTIDTASEGNDPGNITVDDAVTWGQSTTLTLNADNDIAINNSITATGGGGIEIHAAGDVTQNAGTIANTIAGSSVLGNFDINISGQIVKLHSVASQRNIDITAQSLTVGSIQALGGQGFHVDDSYFAYQLPFSFSFYGTPYTTAYISSNGIITFGSGTSAYTDSVNGLSSYKIIAASWNDWDTRGDPNLDVYVSGGANALAVRWNVVRYNQQMSKSAQFETLLYSNGNIKFNYGPASISFAGDVTIGLSNQSLQSRVVSQLMNQQNFSMNYLRSTTFSYANGQYSETLSNGSDWSATMYDAGTSRITSLGDINFTSTGGIIISGIVSAGGSSLTATAGGNITLGGLFSAAAGYVTLNSGGAIINGMGSSTSVLANTLDASAVSGIGSGNALMTQVHNLNADNQTANNIEISNTGVLAIGGFSNGGTGDVIISNIGAITTGTATVTSLGGSVSITAHSPLTIGSGGVAASGDIALEAAPSGGSDGLTINGSIASANGSIALAAGSSIVLGPGANLSAPNGTIILTDQLNAPVAPAANSTVTGNMNAANNTFVALESATETIATVTTISDEDKREEEERKKKKEGGGKETDEQKMDSKDKKYCN